MIGQIMLLSDNKNINGNSNFSLKYEIGKSVGIFVLLIFTADLPTIKNTIIATFEDATALLATNNYPVKASKQMKRHQYFL